MGIPGEAIVKGFCVLMQHHVFFDFVCKGCQLTAIGQFAVQQEVTDLKKICLFRKYFDWNTPVAQNAFLAINECNITVAAAGIKISRIQRDIAGVCPKFSNIYCSFSLGSDNNW